MEWRPIEEVVSLFMASAPYVVATASVIADQVRAAADRARGSEGKLNRWQGAWEGVGKESKRARERAFVAPGK
eukprot:1683013-Pleurochrysis_carterae.AAC.1